MAMKSDSLEHWRNYFRTMNGDIFDVIDRAIMVAASDCPKEFKLRRDRIAERLFSCRLTRCSGCDRVELAVPAEGCDEDDDDGLKSGEECDYDEPGGSKESKVNSTSRDGCHDHEEVLVNQVSNYSYGEAEALTDEIEEESLVVGEVLRIKEVLLNSRDESESVLYESLRRLQLMGLSVSTLKSTGIGKAVNPLRKHGLKEISRLAQTLIALWKAMVDEWFQAAPAIAESTPESVNPSSADEEGLPSPPLDEGAFFAAQTTTMELSQFFDGMDDDGNPHCGGNVVKNPCGGAKPMVAKPSAPEWLKEQSLDKVDISPKDRKSQQMKKQENIMKPSRPLHANSVSSRHTNGNVDRRTDKHAKIQPRRTDKVSVPKRNFVNQQDESKRSEEAAVQMKLEATKRKLQESYQQAENAKKQRTIQVMDLHDLPKQALVNKNPQMRLGNHNRHWVNGWR